MNSILFLTEEEEREFRHLCFQDEVFPLLSAAIKVLRPDYTQHSPTEIWITTTLLTLRLITEEEPEEVEDEIDTCAHQGCDGFLLLFVAMFQLAAMHRQAPQAEKIAHTIMHHIQHHDLYAPLFAAVKAKERQRMEMGKQVDMDHYRPVVVNTDHGNEGENIQGVEIVRALVDVAIEHADSEMCDKLELLLRRLDILHGDCFEKEIARLAQTTNKRNQQANKPRVNAKEYNNYESGSTHEDYRRQINVEPTNATLKRIGK